MALREDEDMGKRFEVDGVIHVNQSEPEADPARQCLCCRPRGHVFGIGISLPGEPTVPGQVGQVAARPSDWLFRILYARRFEPGRKVRLTLELLDDETECPDRHVKAEDVQCGQMVLDDRGERFLVHEVALTGRRDDRLIFVAPDGSEMTRKRGDSVAIA